jgi:hypothetical protein
MVSLDTLEEIRALRRAQEKCTAYTGVIEGIVIFFFVLAIVSIIICIILVSALGSRL